MSFLEVGQAYAKLWQAVLDSVTVVNTQSANLCQTARTLGVSSPDVLLDVSKYLKSTRKEFFHAILRNAADRFGVAGEAVRIDQDQFSKRFLPNDGCFDDGSISFDPVGLAHALTEEYAACGEALALAQVAKEITSFFWIRGGKSIERKRGGIVLNASIFIDGIDKKHSNVNRLSIQSREKLRKGFCGLAKFARWTGFHKTDAELMAEANRDNLLSYNRNIVSRKKHTFGEIIVTEYSTRFEFFFPDAIAQALMLFIAEFGAVDQQDVA